MTKFLFKTEKGKKYTTERKILIKEKVKMPKLFLNFFSSTLSSLNAIKIDW